MTTDPPRCRHLLHTGYCARPARYQLTLRMPGSDLDVTIVTVCTTCRYAYRHDTVIRTTTIGLAHPFSGERPGWTGDLYYNAEGVQTVHYRPHDDDTPVRGAVTITHAHITAEVYDTAGILMTASTAFRDAVDAAEFVEAHTAAPVTADG